MLAEHRLDGLRVVHPGASRVADLHKLVRRFQQATASIVIADTKLPGRPVSNDTSEAVPYAGSQAPLHDG